MSLDSCSYLRAGLNFRDRNVWVFFFPLMILRLYLIVHMNPQNDYLLM